MAYYTQKIGRRSIRYFVMPMGQDILAPTDYFVYAAIQHQQIMDKSAGPQAWRHAVPDGFARFIHLPWDSATNRSACWDRLSRAGLVSGTQEDFTLVPLTASGRLPMAFLLFVSPQGELLTLNELRALSHLAFRADASGRCNTNASQLEEFMNLGATSIKEIRHEVQRKGVLSWPVSQNIQLRSLAELGLEAHATGSFAALCQRMAGMQVTAGATVPPTESTTGVPGSPPSLLTCSVMPITNQSKANPSATAISYIVDPAFMVDHPIITATMHISPITMARSRPSEQTCKASAPTGRQAANTQSLIQAAMSTPVQPASTSITGGQQSGRISSNHKKSVGDRDVLGDLHIQVFLNSAPKEPPQMPKYKAPELAQRVRDEINSESTYGEIATAINAVVSMANMEVVRYERDHHAYCCRKVVLQEMTTEHRSEWMNVIQSNTLIMRESIRNNEVKMFVELADHIESWEEIERLLLGNHHDLVARSRWGMPQLSGFTNRNLDNLNAAKIEELHVAAQRAEPQSGSAVKDMVVKLLARAMRHEAATIHRHIEGQRQSASISPARAEFYLRMYEGRTRRNREAVSSWYGRQIRWDLLSLSLYYAEDRGSITRETMSEIVIYAD